MTAAAVLSPRSGLVAQRRRAAVAAAVVAVAFAAVGGQIVRLAARGQPATLPRLAATETQARTWVRPDILDRRGRLLAGDVPQPSLWADPSVILDAEEVVDKLMLTLTGLDEAELRRTLADRSRRFVWIRRGMRPRDAQRVHELGLPGLGFRQEPKRVYPAGALAGHILGTVNIDNKGTAGLERYIDDTLGAEAALGPHTSRTSPLNLSIDAGAQHLLADELRAAMGRFRAKGAAGLVMDVTTGEIIAAASLPGIDPGRPTEALDPARLDRLMAGVFELGSVWKIITIALALESGIATLDRVYDITLPLTIGRFTITDLNPQRRPLSVRDIFIHSSNVGSGMIALEAGAELQKAFLARLGLLEAMRLEAGAVSAPLLPASWGKAETVTIAYGHGLAIAPVQFAAAIATLVNGGYRVVPTLIARRGSPPGEERVRVVSAGTSQHIRELMRQGVALAHGTGRRADVKGLEIGGKTGTAEMPGRHGYQEKSVISTFVAITPASAPRYLALVSLFEPQGTEETQGHITAGRNAAPTTGRILARLAPLMQRSEAH